MLPQKKRGFILYFGQRERLTMSEYQEMATVYDELWEKAEAIIRKFDPCKIRKGICFAGRCCCTFCEFLTRTGCKEKSLACKLWLCPDAREKNPECALLLDELEEIAKSHPHIPLKERSIKEDIVSFYEIVEG